VTQQQEDAATQAAEGSKRHKDRQRSRQREQQQQQPSQQRQGPAAASSSRGGRQRQQQRQQQQKEQLPQLRTSQPRPHPFYIKPKHVKRHFKVTTVDGWKLHLIRLVAQMLTTAFSAWLALMHLSGCSFEDQMCAAASSGRVLA
jgi:hypothetical protein